MQGTTAPSDPAKALAALRRVRPPGKELVLRLNRMFWSDGRAGLDRFAGLVDSYARAGFRSELQVRYHPPDGHAGDMAGWYGGRVFTESRHTRVSEHSADLARGSSRRRGL